MLRLILIIVIGLIALSFFGISLKGIIESPAGQANFQYAWQLVQLGWQHLVSFGSGLIHHS